MKLPEKSVDSAFVQRYVDVVHANGFGCRIEEQPDSNTFLVSINNQRMRFPDTIPGRVEAASFINTNMLQMEAAMHKLLTMMKYCNNVNIGLAEPVKQEKNPAGDIFSVKLSGVYEPVKETKLYEQEMIAKNDVKMVEVPDIRVVGKKEIFAPKIFEVFTGPQFDPSSFDSARVDALASEIGLRAVEADRILSENGGPANAILNSKGINPLRDLANDYQDNLLSGWAYKNETWREELYNYTFGYDDGTITLEEKGEALETKEVEEVATSVPDSPVKESFFSKVKQAISDFFHPEQKRLREAIENNPSNSVDFSDTNSVVSSFAEMADDDGGRDDI